MQISRNIFFAVFISMMLALLLSFLPEINRTEPRIYNQPAFQTVNTLTKQNLVDFIADQDIHYPIERVNWENQNLLVDLGIPEMTPLDNHKVIEDLYSVIELAYARVHNVREVHIRVLIEHNNKKNLLIALSAHRNQVKQDWPFRPSVADMKDFLEKQFHVYYGALWQQKF
ncbi:MAG: hypothetical protein H0Z33_02275 [Bacillaceae bacterium]|nr:hypothetical protein [Bacillaceae bacterium]